MHETTVLPRYNLLIVALLLLSIMASTTLAGYIPPGPKYPCPTKPALFYPCRCVSGSDVGLNVHCHNSNLASLSIAFTNVAAVRAPLQTLTISAAKFSRLYGGLLYALEVKKLYIEDTPLKIIEPQTFLGVNRTLEELHLIRTQLQEFPKDAFQNLGKLTVLNIEGHRLTSLPVGTMAGQLPNNLEKLSITNGNLTDLSVETLVACKKLKRLDLHGNNLKTLKRNQFKGLRNVEYLDLSHNSILKIDPSHLADLNKMSWCNLSHNAISDITRGAFARNTVLRSLNLNHNKLKKLDSNSFRGMRFIRRLYLADNEISEVGRGTFGAVSRIGTIDLARNKIKKIDYQMFSQLQYAELIDVSDNLVTEIQKLAFTDLYLVHINLSHNAISKIEPGAFENCANITKLDLSYNKLDTFPPKSFDEITYATELQLSYNNLTDLSKVPLGNMTGLKVLNVTHNRLQIIPRNTFPKLYELHTIDLSHNEISSIYNSVFQTLFSLRSLNLSYNSMTEIKSSTFGPVPTLLELDLSNNQLTDVIRGALTRLVSLQRLDISRNRLTTVFQIPGSLSTLNIAYNEISKISPRTWPTMNALLTLDLSDNYLEDSLDSGSFSNLITLQSLDLSRNYITEPPWESLVELSSLQYLYLMGNNLTTLSKGAFGKLPVVFELNLAENQINNISKQAFDGLLQLLSLNLSSNGVSYLPNGVFQGLVSLRALDLSHNNLETLDNKTHGLFDDCFSLETLNLSHNKISYVTRKTFPNDPYQPYKLREIDLSFNVMPALTYDLTFGTKKVERLNLSNNMIDEIRRGVIGNLTSLTVLDLSHNELKDLTEPHTFDVQPKLSELYIENNHLQTIPIEKLEHLDVLDASNNHLEYYTEITIMVKNGSRVFYAGNEINCDCRLRPLRRLLLEDWSSREDWKDVICSLPRLVAGKSILAANEEDMYCNGESVLENEEYDTTPDIKFREVERNPNGKISLTWYVTAKEDIADFSLVVKGPERRGAKEKTMLKKSLTYSTRSAILTNFPNEVPLELCIVALDSEGNERALHNLQCRSVNSTGSGSNRSTTSPGIHLLLFTSLLVFLSVR